MLRDSPSVPSVDTRFVAQVYFAGGGWKTVGRATTRAAAAHTAAQAFVISADDVLSSQVRVVAVA
jgi:hypothetical protein